MDWDHDVCLSCDNQTQEGEKFCSQACRLADLERAGYSEPATPGSLPNNFTSWDSWHMSSSGRSTGSQRNYFQLEAPINFSSYRAASNFESPPASPRSRMPTTRPQSTSYFPQQHHHHHHHHHQQQQQSMTLSGSHPATGRGLTQSPSRSSLSSVTSSTTTTSSTILSEETMNQLRDYSGAFDTTRGWRRRTTVG